MPQSLGIVSYEPDPTPQGGLGIVSFEPDPPARSRVGLLVAGNVDLSNRPRVKNPDGSISTVRSMSFEEDGREILVPTVSDDGRLLTDDQAIDMYHKTGKHLGIFSDVESANSYAQQLHQQQAAQIAKPAQMHADGYTNPASVRVTTPPPTRLARDEFGRPALQPFQRVPALDAILTSPIAGVKQIAKGIGGVTSGPATLRPMRTGEGPIEMLPAAPKMSDQTLSGGSDIIEGGFKLLAPLAIPAAISNPLITAAILGTGIGAQMGTEAGAKKLGASEQQARFAGNLAAILSGAVVGGGIKAVTDYRAATAGVRAAARARASAAEVLGVEPTADAETIQSAYRAAARANHPDLNPDANPSKMADINLAYEWLVDHPAAAVPPSNPSAAAWARDQIAWLKSKLQPEAPAEPVSPRLLTEAPPSPAAPVSAPGAPPLPPGAVAPAGRVEPAGGLPALLGRLTDSQPVAPVVPPAALRFGPEHLESTAPAPTASTPLQPYLSDVIQVGTRVVGGNEKPQRWRVDDITPEYVELTDVTTNIPTRRRVDASEWPAFAAGATVEKRTTSPSNAPLAIARYEPDPEPVLVEQRPKDEQYKFSSTQVDLPPATAQAITAFGKSIPKADLADDGREAEPHVTVKYGLHTTDVEKVRDLVAGEPPITVTLGKTSFFPNGESGSGDVLKVDIDSPDLHRLNQKIADALEHTDTHPEYVPHATIAYLKPGLGKKYAGDERLAGQTVTVDRLTFSGKDGRVYEIPLTGQPVQATPDSVPEDTRMALQQAAVVPMQSVDWGSRARASGKRSGGLVRGGMSDPPTGIKQYADFEHAKGVTPEVWAEISVMEDEDKRVVIGALQSGYSVDAALKLGYQEPPKVAEAGLPTRNDGSKVGESHGTETAVQPGSPSRSPEAQGPGDGPAGRNSKSPRRRRPAKAPVSDAEVLNELIARARAGGYQGDEGTLRRELDDRLSFIKEFDTEHADSGRNPDVLLRAIARMGGIGIREEGALKGELRWLQEHARRDFTRTNAFGQVGNVQGVIKKKGGLPADLVLTQLRQEHRFGHIETLDDLIDAIRIAATTHGDDRAAADRLAASLGERWWEAIGQVPELHVADAIDPGEGDVSFNPSEFEDAQPIDILDTGEQQPRLPEAGAVRDTDVKTPQFEAPFSLSSEADTTPEGKQDSLLDTSGHKNPSGGGTEGMAGLFAEPEPASAGRRIDTVQPIQFPELVGLARELASTPSVVKAFRMDGKLGEFRGDTGQIRLHADLFKKGNEHQLAATLAHEIGHLVDWLPHRTLKRGNILGRIYSLRSFLKDTFIGPDGDHITLKDVLKELVELSAKWRPWDPDTATPSFKAYRNSPKEIFADAISVLLNDPGLLEKDAPIFYRQFFLALDEKPDVKRAYFDLQELLSGTPKELITRRRAGVREMFEGGDTKAMDLERLRQQEAQAARKDVFLRLRIQTIDKNTPIIDRVKALEKQGIRINPDDDPRYFLEERNYLGGKLKAFTARNFQPIYEGLLEAGIDWHTFGEALFYERIIAGDRSELANPRGLAPQSATDLLNDLMTTLTPDQRRVTRDSMTKFRDVVKSVAENAYREGMYTDEFYQDLQKNPAYVTFRVIEHLEDNVTSRVYRQVGTLKDITNPADASMLKTLVTLRAIEHQKTKKATFNFLAQHYPGDIEQAKEVWTPKGPQPVEAKDPKKQRLITYYERGRRRGKYVDPYIADSLENASVGQNLAIVTALRWANGFLRPVFTGLNPGFQTFNLYRDFFRTWKNTPGMTLAKAMKRYAQAVPMARVRAFGLPEHASFRMRRAEKELLEAEDAKILSVTFNDLIAGREVEDTQIEETLSRMGVGSFTPPGRSAVMKPIGALLDWLKHVGDFIETLPKAAALHEFKGAGTISAIPADKRSFIRRKIGSPDYLARGTFTPVTNEVLLFSNAIVQAMRSDFEVATDPKTRSGYWWKTAKLNIAPKLVMLAVLSGGAAALASLAGDDKEDKESRLAQLRRVYRGVSEYDKTNYTIVPLGLDSKGNSVYVRMPQDDSGRFIGGLLWKAISGAKGDASILETAMSVFDYTAGQAPGVTPVLSVGTDAAQFAANGNVYDPFRGRTVLSDDEAKAGGLPAASKFLKYEFQQVGGGIVWKFDVASGRPRERSTAQKILDFPIVSNTIGRWIKISNYGEVERLRGAEAEVQKAEAQHRQAERDAVSAAIQTLQQLADGDRTTAKQTELARQIVSQVDANKSPRDQASAVPDVLKKLRMGLVRGQADPLTDAVMSATSNAQKVAAITEAADGMAPTDVRAWLNEAMRQRVISPELMIAAQRALRSKQPAAAAR